MPVDILIAPPASGKTRTIIQHLQEVLKTQPLSPVWVIVPDRFQAQHFRQRLALSGGAVGAQVGTFHTFYREVLARAGQSTPEAPESMLTLLIQLILDELAEKGELNFYSSIRRTPGFLRVLRERFSELKDSLVTPEYFHEVTRLGTPAVHELGRVYATYLQQLQEYRWADQEGITWLAIEALKNHPDLLKDWRLVALDGFDEFSPARRAALRLISEQVPETIVTLTGAPGLARASHLRFLKAIEKLREEMSVRVAWLDEKPHLPKSLASLEANLFDQTGEKATYSEGRLHLLALRRPADEAREALRWMKALISRTGLRPRQCAIFVPDTNLYHPYLRSVAREFGVPIHFSWGETLQHAPATAALLDLLRLPVEDFPFRRTLDCLRSPFLDWESCDFHSGDPKSLENMCCSMQIMGGLNAWREAFHILGKDPFPGPATLSEELEEGARQEGLATAIPRIPSGAGLSRMAEAFEKLVTYLPNFSDRKGPREWVTWLEHLLKIFRFSELCEAPVYAAIQSVLQAMLISYRSISLSLSYLEFVNRFHSLLENAFYSPAEMSSDAIFTGRFIEARGLRFQAVAVLGLAEGLFPVVERVDPFLSEGLRQQLALESRIGRDQAGLFYQAVTRANEYLFLSRPYLAEGGEPLEPSPYWEEVCRLCIESPVRITTGSRNLTDAASVQEALFWGNHQHLIPESEPELIERAKFVEEAWNAFQMQLDPLNERGLIPERSEKVGSRLADPASLWSPSRLEMYAACPSRFYLEAILGLEPQATPQPGFDAAQLGTMLHNILEKVYRSASDPTNPDQVLELLPQVAAEEFSQAPTRYKFRPSPFWQIEQRELGARLQRTILALAEISAGWRPFAYEQVFGMRNVPAFEIKTTEGPIRLRGVIDRLDINQAGNIRVIDYKTGGSLLAPKDLQEGRRLQLPLYAAAVKAIGLGEITEGIYWNIFGAKPGSLRLADFETGGESGVEAAIQVAQGHTGRILAGVRQGDFRAQPPRDGCPDYCAARTWCWHYRGR